MLTGRSAYFALCVSALKYGLLCIVVGALCTPKYQTSRHYEVVQSAHTCQRLHSSSVCRFKNVCVPTTINHGPYALLYYLPDNVVRHAPSGPYASISDPSNDELLLALRPFALTERAQGIASEHHFLAVQVVRTSVERHSLWIKSTALVFAPFWPENWGHAVFDDLYSIWCALRLFDLKSKQVSIFYTTFPFSNESFVRRAKEVYRAFATRLGMQTPTALQGTSSPSDYICFADLVAGTGALSMREYPHRLQDFSRSIRIKSRQRYGTLKSNRVHITFLDKKDGRHRRRIRNLPSILHAVTAEFQSAHVDVLDSAEISGLHLVERLGVLHKIDILVAAGGAASLNAAFMRPGTVLIILDVYEPSSNSSVTLEPYIWNAITDVRTFFFKVTDKDMVISAESSERPKSDPLYTDFLYRDFADYELSTSRLLAAVRAAFMHLNAFRPS